MSDGNTTTLQPQAQTQSSPRTENDVNIFIGHRILQRRQILGWSQKRLAAAVGVRFQQIQKYESAVNRVYAFRLLQLSEIMQVPVAYFYPD